MLSRFLTEPTRDEVGDWLSVNIGWRTSLPLVHWPNQEKILAEKIYVDRIVRIADVTNSVLVNVDKLLIHIWGSQVEMCQMAPVVLNDVGWVTLSKRSESTRRGESHNKGIPYDDHVMFGRGSPMYFEKIKRKPSKVKKTNAGGTIRETKET